MDVVATKISNHIQYHGKGKMSNPDATTFPFYVLLVQWYIYVAPCK